MPQQHRIQTIREIEPDEFYMNVYWNAERVLKTMGMKNRFAYIADLEKREEFSYLGIPNLWQIALIATNIGFFVDTRVNFFFASILKNGLKYSRMGNRPELQISLTDTWARKDHECLIRTAIGLIENTLKLATPFERLYLTIQQ